MAPYQLICRGASVNNVMRRIVSNTTFSLARAQHHNIHYSNNGSRCIFTNRLTSQEFNFNFINENQIKSIAKKFASFTNSNVDKVDSNNISADNSADFRAEAKLMTLKDAKEAADEAKKKYITSKNQIDTDLNTQKVFYDSWLEHEAELSDAYSKAIKYIAKLRSKDTAMKSRQLLDEMISRHGIPTESLLYLMKNHEDGNDVIINDNEIVEFIERLRFDEHGLVLNIDESDEVAPSMKTIPPPTKQDCHNIIHSWASSKVKRKGLHAESLLWRMMELSKQHPRYFDFPDSKTFGLVIKCYATSTYKYSQERIKKLHFYHEKLTSKNKCPLVKDDPNLLLHSIKSIADFKEQRAMLSDWLDRLHTFALQQGHVNAHDEALHDDKINLTGTYNSVLRGIVREGEVHLAHKILQQMHEIDNNNRAKSMAGLETHVTIDIKTNSYNLVLGSCRTQSDKLLAIELLNKMIASMKASRHGKPDISVPFPDDQSFASVIRILTFMADVDSAKQLARKLVLEFEDSVKHRVNQPSANVHNAYISFLIYQCKQSNDLLKMCKEILNRLKRQQGGTNADSTTWDLLLKAYALDCEIRPQNRDSNLKAARKMFNEINTGTKGKLSDKSIQYMMQCISSLEEDEERKKEVLELFKMACNNGFVNADVLRILKLNVSDEEYQKIVGNGRLADKWIKNVTSNFVRYTDFTLGGANKNARRKGKSTSNWEKKQQQKFESIQVRKQSKIKRKEKRSLQL